MQPIISPWFIYLLGVINSIKTTFEAIAIISGIGLILIMVGYCLCKYTDDFDDDYVPIWRKLKNWTIPIFITFLMLAIFTPSRNTLIGIIITKNITHDNVEKALDAGKDFKEEIKKDIFELIETLQNKEK